MGNPFFIGFSDNNAGIPRNNFGSINSWRKCHSHRIFRYRKAKGGMANPAAKAGPVIYFDGCRPGALFTIIRRSSTFYGEK